MRYDTADSQQDYSCNEHVEAAVSVQQCAPRGALEADATRNLQIRAQVSQAVHVAPDLPSVHVTPDLLLLQLLAHYPTAATNAGTLSNCWHTIQLLPPQLLPYCPCTVRCLSTGDPGGVRQSQQV